MKTALNVQVSGVRSQVPGLARTQLLRLLFAFLMTIALVASCSADVLKIYINDAIQPVTTEYIARAG